MNDLQNISLEKVLFYLSILIFGKLELSDLSLKSISIKLFGSIENVDKEVMINLLNEKLNSYFEDHPFREELSFGVTHEKYENINPKYEGCVIRYILQKNRSGTIALFAVKF